MKLSYKIYKLKWKIKRIDLKYSITYFILSKLNQDTISKYSIDNDLCTDYYNEEPDNEDYRNDRD